MKPATRNAKPFVALILLLCVLAAGNTQAADPAAGADQPALTFAIVPQQSASKLAKLWSPILKHLSEKSGHRLVFKTAKNIPTFEQRLSQGEYDIAYMNPYHYTVYHDEPGYTAMAKARDKRIKGIVVVHKDSPVQSLEDLAGEQLAFPSPAAFAASILTRSEFQARGVAFEPQYVSSHDSVYRNVASGRMAAGGGVLRTFNNVDPEIRDQLRILWTTPGYTPHAIAVHPRVPAEVVQDIQRALVEMDATAEGSALLESIRLKGLEAAVDGDWDDVRALRITLLQ